MLQVYTLISTFLFIFLLPVIVLISLTRKKYRGRILQRLGLSLPNICHKNNDPERVCIWIHALSVGEVTSALPLIKGIREKYPEALIFFSSTTRSGLTTAKQLAEKLVDGIFFSPFDVPFAVQRCINQLNPSLFILVETDFWPGWIYTLKKNSVPCLLVNGRFSKKSLQTYQRFHFLFQPMFTCFSLLSMQTEQDADALQQMGLAKNKITTLGNLKFDSSLATYSFHAKTITRQELGFPEHAPLIICGSTHRGEEQIIFQAFTILTRQIPELCLLLAPRDIHRAAEIEALAGKYSFSIRQRTACCQEKQKSPQATNILLLDTLGELGRCYQLGDIALIGGSLVPAGGHNPLEAAAAGIPILFGLHMEDFAEISQNLISAQAALTVTNSQQLAQTILTLLKTPTLTKSMGHAARKIINSNQGVIPRHLEVIKQLLKQ